MRQMPRAASKPAGDLLNLGPTSARWLSDIGISTVAQLRRKGAVPTSAPTSA